MSEIYTLSTAAACTTARGVTHLAVCCACRVREAGSSALDPARGYCHPAQIEILTHHMTPSHHHLREDTLCLGVWGLYVIIPSGLTQQWLGETEGPRPVRHHRGLQQASSRPDRDAFRDVAMIVRQCETNRELKEIRLRERESVTLICQYAAGRRRHSAGLLRQRSKSGVRITSDYGRQTSRNT